MASLNAEYFMLDVAQAAPGGPSGNAYYAATIDNQQFPPTIQNISPSSGLGRRQAVQFDLVDDTGLFAAIVVGVNFNGRTRPEEFIYCLDSFSTRYAGSSVVDVSATRKRFTVRPLFGWPATPTFLVVATDTTGAVNT